VQLPFISFEDSGSIVCYCPALDVAGYGKTDEEATQSFFIALSEFFTYTLNKNTFITELEKMGWKVKKSKTKPMTPPSMSELLENNENFSNIFNRFPFKKFDKKVQIPV
jgi:hypothetical protein